VRVCHPSRVGEYRPARGTDMWRVFRPGIPGKLIDVVGPIQAPGPTFAAKSGLPPRGDPAGRRRETNWVGYGLNRSGGVVMGSGDGWTMCAAGHRHWGRFGAAGLLIIDGDKAVLQHRAPWTHEGDTWGVVGGARNAGEDALTAALREAGEEAAIDPGDVDPIGIFVDDHSGWSYTTVVARPVGALAPAAANAESVSVSWHAFEDIANLRLHSGFATAWPHLKLVPEPLYLIVTGSAAVDPLLAVLVRTGIAAERLPSGMSAGGLNRLFPRVIAVESVDATAAPSVQYSDPGQVVIATSTEDLQLLA